MAKIDSSLFSSDKQVSAAAIAEAYGDCPECASPLLIKYANKQSFLACSAYPTCEHRKSLTDNSITTIKVMHDTPCPQCDLTLAIKKGRYGLFVGCVDFPSCNYIGSIKPQTDTQVTCPECSTGHLLEKTNKYGKKFYACDHYPKCKYVINSKPVAQPCPICHASIMIQKNASSLECINTTCSGKIDIV